MHTKGLFGYPFIHLPAHQFVCSFIHPFIHSLSKGYLRLYPEPSVVIREAGDRQGHRRRRKAQGSRPWLERVLPLTQFLESKKGLGRKKKRGPANGLAGYGTCTIETSHQMGISPVLEWGGVLAYV